MDTSNKYLVKGEDKNFALQAFNSSGGIIDLTSATIIFTVKTSRTDSTALFQRKNTAAGGNDNEIEVATNMEEYGLFIVKISRTNSLSLEAQPYPFDVTVNDGTSYITHSGTLIVQQSVNDGSTVTRNYGTTAQRPTYTTSDVGKEYFDTDLDAPVWWNGANWSDE